ncbi:tandem-95 repeat protein [Brassicibacter mesophilus]|uniref:tandem-95 repeat protein n=1 Tax=Brassicibacter mesophilus TaxID=745119 RepID=UPI003D1FA8FF
MKVCKKIFLILLLMVFIVGQYQNAYTVDIGTNIVTNGDAEAIADWTNPEGRWSSMYPPTYGGTSSPQGANCFELYNAPANGLNLQKELYQIIDVSSLSTKIDNNALEVDARSYIFRGYDSGSILPEAALKIEALNSSGENLDTFSVQETGPISQWVNKSINSQKLPVGTRKLKVVLYGDVRPDSYVRFDDISLVLTVLNIPPTVNSSTKTEMENSTLSFTQTDFTNNYIDKDGDSLTNIQITSLPDNGTLKLNGANIAINQVIPVADLNSINFVPNADWHGTTSFKWKGYDGEIYSSNEATLTIQIEAIVDSDGNVSASAVIDEPVPISTTIDTTGEAIDIFDFTISDGGSRDGLPLSITEISVNVSGTSTDVERNQITYRLNGADASNVTGTYNDGLHTVTFSDLSISVADGGSETYTINTYYNDNTNLTEGHTLILSVDGDTDFTVDLSGTQMGATAAVTNGIGSTVDVIATQLAFDTQPNSSISGSAFATQPVVAAQDDFGNIDVDFSEIITLTESSSGSLTGGKYTYAACGIATFTNLNYTATSDQESFTLTANDQDDVGTDLPTVDSNTVTCDVVAQKLIFTTEPLPTTVYSGEAMSFTTVPVIQAVDASDIVDSGYSTKITISTVNGGGSATLLGTGDSDTDSSTVTLSPSSGAATFTGLEITYTASGFSNEAFKLIASSGGLIPAYSDEFTAIVNVPPSFDEGDTHIIDIDENTPNDTIITTLGVTDSDIGANLTISITGGNIGDAFRLSTASETSTGESIPIDIIVNNSSELDYETRTSYDLTIEASDGMKTDTITVTINLNNLNDNSPWITADSFSIDENSPNGTSVGKVKGSDLDGDVLIYSITSGNDSGAFALDSSTGEITVVDETNLDYETTTEYLLNISCSDGINDGCADITININNINDNVPIIDDLTININENTENGTVIGTVTASDADGSLNPNIYSFISGNESEAFSMNSDTGQITIADETKIDYELTTLYSLIIEVTDGSYTDTATVTINVKDLNDNSPTITNIGNISIDEDNSTGQIAFTIGDKETSASSLLITVTSNNHDLVPNENITLAGTDENRTIEITPAANENGTAMITVKVSDGEKQTSESFVVTVNPVNDKPIANDDNYSTDEDILLVIDIVDILANDFDVDKDDEISIVLFTQPSNGTVTSTVYGTVYSSVYNEIHYTPDLNFVGIDSFTYTIEDKSGARDTANIKINVGSVNDEPIISSISNIIINEDESIEIGFSVDDAETNLNDLDIYATSSNNILLPTENIFFSGSGENRIVKLVPENNKYGDATIRIFVNDGLNEIYEEFTLNVNSVNDIPLAVNDNINTKKDTSVTIDVLSNDSDIEGDTLNIINVTQGSNGTVVINTDNTITYTPKSGFSGTDSFEYTISDGNGGENKATVNITVNSTIKSNNANLSNIAISSGNLSPDFSKNITQYQVNVENSVNNIMIMPTVEEAHSRIKVSGEEVISGNSSQAINLNVGSNTINVEVTAEDGVTKKTYTIIIKRSKASKDDDDDEDDEENPQPKLEDILINGKAEDMATAEVLHEDGKTILEVTIDDEKIQYRLESIGKNSTVAIPISGDFDRVSGQLNGQTVKNMEAKEAVLEIKTENASYILPASQINIDSISQEIGSEVELKDIKVKIEISKPSEDIVKIVEDTANKNNYQIIVKPIEFNIYCSYEDKTVKVSKFKSYVERMVKIPDGIDPSQITTGVVLNDDGTFTHVPTTIVEIEGTYYARINSLTNSTYSVIYSPKTFKDVENHWSREAVNDMASRLVINGVSENIFEPNRDITRAEFAAITVNALGLMRKGESKEIFVDVKGNDWYYDAVSKAYEYKLISGYNDGTFRPNDKITREEAMAIIASAMNLTGLNSHISENDIDAILNNYSDGNNISTWAKESVARCIIQNIVTGYDNQLMVKENITRAETTTIIQKMLKVAKLI